MATVVIVPGATHGGWRWTEARLALQASGHEVHTLTLTGLGERSHLASPAIDLQTHILDVVHVLEYEDLHDVVLVGHSYGGMVLTAVADRAAARLARLIYVDAVLPNDGECALDAFPPAVRAKWEEEAQLHGEGWRIPPTPGDDPRAVPMPLKPTQQPLHLTGTDRSAIPAVYIHSTVKPKGDHVARSVDRAREWGWPVFDLATGHLPLLNEAERAAFVDLLLKIV